MPSTLIAFFKLFRESFNPPKPYRGASGSNWLVSRVWSARMKAWLEENFSARFEIPAGGRRRLDAALWRPNGVTGHSLDCKMDFALEWEWDNTKVYDQFPTGDFTKVLEVDAKSGLGIIHTRADGARGVAQADETLDRIRESLRTNRFDDRPVGLIEIRRVNHRAQQVEFTCNFIDFAGDIVVEPSVWRFRG